MTIKMKCIVCELLFDLDESMRNEAYICPKCWKKIQPKGKVIIHDETQKNNAFGSSI